MKKGQISVHTENILPIIKKWLYSDKDIYLRELVSNAQDAIMKFKKLVSLGEAQAQGDDYAVHVSFNKTKKTITISDNGIGMTEQEVEKYINQVAFSGAEDFIAKYEKEQDESGQIIGHFGLGFYSAFMVSEQVEIDTLSYQPGAKPVHWISDGGSEFEITDGTRSERGTTITLHIAKDSEEYLDLFSLRKILDKYCGFLPVNIYLDDEEAEPKKEGEEPAAPTPLNDPNPLWLKNPADCTDEEYKAFYHKVFMDFGDPLFWIHLNVDFPFNLKGILYFPKLNHEMQSIEGQIKLYNNQVFIADNIKEVTPEYLMLLKGVIDCPDLPLNVSRSFLQNDGYVAKVSSHIIKKVSDKLVSLFKTERETYEKYWDDISPFIKYGCIRDEKFYERLRDVLLFKHMDGTFVPFKDLLEADTKEIYYVTDADKQAQYIELLQSEKIEPVLLPSMIDNHFVSFLEFKNQDVRFKRVDSYIADSLKSDEAEAGSDKDQIAAAFAPIVDEKVTVEAQALKSEKIPALFVISEDERRVQEMAQQMGGANAGMFIPETKETLVVNSQSPLVKKAISLPDGDTKTLILNQVYDMARLTHKSLTGEQLSAFLERSGDILLKLADL